MTTIIVFGASIVLLGAFIGFKMFEERLGMPLFAERRARLDIKAELFLGFVKKDVPIIVRSLVHRGVENTLRSMSLGLMHFGNAVRRDLHAVAERIDGKVDLRRRGVASFYLREVAEHKRSLATADIRPTRTV